MAEQGRLVGYLDDRVAAPYGGQAVSQLADGRYVLADGKGISRDVLQQLLSRGLLVSAEASHARTIVEMQPFVPERVDPKATDGVVYAKDRDAAVARVDYHAGRPYEGDLVFRSNLDGHFVTEKGYVLDLRAMQDLGEGGMLLVPKATKPEDPYRHESSRSVLISSSERFSRRQHWSKLGFLLVAIVLIAVIAYGVNQGLFGIGQDARDAFEGNTLEEVTSSSKDLGEAEAAKGKAAADALDGADGGAAPAPLVPDTAESVPASGTAAP